ncbi:toxin glutamine deamidase domain-containing protein [Actinokineospora auranticolor]|uniref:Papain fold toxin 1 (Glutamine deamidase) of polymorphic toxin system n=1 Tax=Actinokineospora auranticolor TaxID=155976 RepID=A0A2S6H0B3_9PSEU|nr:toxin glutamine deamidase domain-containing protein [Actinokineospora auranticolor]PPK70919.1 papain fold toxin 1 (glutamine deamidase) of polymorphic toxin system [Actinokineospora auranticolor]
MAMMVSDEVRKLFQVLTGEEWPDANEDKLRALADAWETTANRLTGELAPDLRRAVAGIRSTFTGAAELAFANRMAPYVEGSDNYLSIADEQFRALAKFLRDLALEVEYVKIVSILTLVSLIVEIAWAIAMAGPTAGGSMAWLAARMAIVRWLLKTLLGRLLIRVLQAELLGIAFQLVIDVLAQLIQFGMGSRTEWNPKYTLSAVAVGALGGALTLPLAGIGKAIAHVSTSGLDSWLGKIAKGKFDWHKAVPHHLTEIGVEAFHETFTEALYKYITEGEWEMNPYSATSGAVSGTAGAVGTTIGDALHTPPPPTTPGANGTGENPVTRPDIVVEDDKVSVDDPTAPLLGPNTGPTDTVGGLIGPKTGTPVPVTGGTLSPQVGTGQPGGAGPGPQVPGTATNTGGQGQNGTVGQSGNQTGQQTSTSQGTTRGQNAGQPTTTPSTTPSTTTSTTTAPTTSTTNTPATAQTQPVSTTSTSTSQTSTTPATTAQTSTTSTSTTSTTNAPSTAQTTSQTATTATQTGTTQSNSGQSGAAQSQSTSNKVAVGQGGTPSTMSQTSSTQAGTTQSTSGQSGATQSQSNKVAVGQGGTPSTVSQTSSTQAGTSQSNSGQNGAAANKVAVGQNGIPSTASQTGSTQAGVSQTNSGQSGAAQSAATKAVGQGSTSSTVSQANSTATTPGPSGKGLPRATQSTAGGKRRADAGRKDKVGESELTRPTTSTPSLPTTAKTPQTAVATAGPDGQGVKRRKVEVAPQVQRRKPAFSVPGRFSDFRRWVGSINPAGGTLNCVDATVAFHSTWRGQATDAGTGRQSAGRAGERTGYAPQYIGEGKAAVDEVVRRVREGGHGTDALVFTTPPGAKDGHAWNIVNQDGVVSHVDAQDGTWGTKTPPAGKVWAITLDPAGEFIGGPTLDNAGSTGPQAIGDSFGRRPIANVANLAAQAVTDARGHQTAAERSVLAAEQQRRSAQAQVVAANEANRQAQAAVAATQAVAAPLIQRLNQIRGQINTEVATLEDQVRAEGLLQQRNDRADQQEDVIAQRVTDAQTGMNNAATPAAALVAQTARDRAQIELDTLVETHRPLRTQLETATRTRRGTQARLAALRTQEAAAHAAARGPHVSATAANTSAQTAGQRTQAATQAATQTNTHHQTTITQRQAAADAVATAVGLQTRITTEAATELRLHNEAQRRLGLADTAAEDLRLLTEREGQLTQRIEGLQNQVDQTKRDIARDKAAAAQQNAGPSNAQQSAPQSTAPDPRERTVAEQEAEIVTLTGQRDPMSAQIVRDTRTAGQLRDEANEAQTQADQQADLVDNLYNQLTTARDDADTAAQAAAAAATSAANTARNAKDLAAEAKNAAKQGDVERGLTLLTDVPFAERIAVERMGDTTGVQNSVTGLFGDQNAAIAGQAGQAARQAVEQHLDDIINQGHEITVTLGDGTQARVLLTGTPKRPGDTRKSATVNAVPNSHPDVVKTVRDDAANPVAISTSSNLPVRVPFVSLVPIVDVVPFLRPVASAGFTLRRNQGMTSNNTSRPGVRTADRAWVETDIEITATRIGNPNPAVSTVDVGMRVPAVVPTNTAPVALPDNGRDQLTSDAVRVPTAFTDGITTQVGAQHRKSVADLLSSPGVRHMRDNGRVTETIGGQQVVVTPNGAPQVSLLGPSNKVDEQRTGTAPSSVINKGSDITAALGMAAGMDTSDFQWFLGLFSDFASQRTGGYTRGNESAVERNATQPELVYQVTRTLDVAVGANAPTQGTVTELVTIPVPVARELGLPIPQHLSPTNSSPRTAGNQPYRIGTDDITAVPRKNDIVTFITNGLDQTGQDAVNEKFDSDPKTVTALYNALHGGEEVNWISGGFQHTLEIYASITPPAGSFPSGQAKATVQDHATSQRRRNDQLSRNARLGLGFEFRPIFKDRPSGKPEGGGTQSSALPRFVVSGTWERSRASIVGTNGRDGRVTAYGGEYRGFDGTMEIVVVHRQTVEPNWFRRVFMGGKMTLGPNSADRLTEPTAAEITNALTQNVNLAANTPQLSKRTFHNAVTVSAPVDKFAWSDQPVTASTMTPGLFVGTPPALANGTVVVDPELFGEFAGIEHVRVTQNSVDALDIVLAKSVETLPVPAPPPNMPAPVTRRSPWAGGMWPSWGTRTVTETNRGGGLPNRQIRYKLSNLTRPGTAAANAVRGFVSQVGRRGFSVLGLNGEVGGPHKLVEPGRLTDMNGSLSATAAYSAPRVVDVRKDGQLQRRQDGDLVVNNTKHRQFGAEAELAFDAMPRRVSPWGARVRMVFGGNKRWGRGKTSELTPGGRQLYNYKGPTVWVAMDVRYTYTGDVNIRNSIKTATTETVPVTVDEPDGVLVQLPARTAAELFTQSGLPVPPEITAVLPNAPAPTGATQHLINGGPGYVSHGTTTVFNSRMHGPDPLVGARARLDELGVTGKWQRDVLERLTELFGSPRGMLSLKDVLSDSGIVSIPNNDPFYQDVVDIRIVATPTAQPAPPAVVRPASRITPLVPNSQTTYSYITTTNAQQNTGSYQLSAGLQTDALHRTAAPRTTNPDGSVTVGPGSKLGMFGALTGVSRQVAESEVAPGSKTLKPMRLLTFDQLDRASHDVTYSLEISRVRTPLPAADTMTLNITRLFNRSDMATTPVTVNGSVDLVAPDPRSSPAMTAPTTAPTFDVLAQNPLKLPPTDANHVQQQTLDPDAQWHIESMGSDTVKAIREAVFAQMSNQPVGNGNNLPRNNFTTAAANRSTYTNKGTTSEYALHSLTTGTALHNGGWSLFSGPTYTTRGIVGAKHALYDDLVDLSIAGRFVPGTFRQVQLPGGGGKVDHGRETEDVSLSGSSRTVTWTRGITAAGQGGGTVLNPNDKLTPGPANLSTAPTAGTDSGIANPDARTNGRFDLTVESQGGRSYLFDVTTEFFVDVKPRNTNWVPALGRKIKGWFGGGTTPPGTVKVTTTDDVRVRVWEADALREGLITIADVWTGTNTAPPTGLGITRAGDGATLHPNGTPAPAPPAPAVVGRDDQGRTLHVAPGVALNQVVDFVAGLGLDVRPHNFTVPNGSAFTARDIADGVAARTAAPDIQQPAVRPDPVVPPEGAPRPVRVPPTTSNLGSSSRTGGLSTVQEDQAWEADPNNAGSSQGIPLRRFGVDEVTGPWAPSTPKATPTSGPGPADGPRGTKRSRDDFEADSGPVTQPEPPGPRAIRDVLAPATPSEVHALESVVPPGTRFSDPNTWVDLVNGVRSDPGRDINCVDAVVSFHSTYHGVPRVAGIGTPGQAPRGAVTQAAEWTSYAPEFIGTGPQALAEVIERVTRAGHGADAMVIAFGAGGGRGHAWNVVNHEGVVSLVDPQQGTIVPATPDAIPSLGRVHAIPLDAQNRFIPGDPVPGAPRGLPHGIATDYASLSTSDNPDWLSHVDEVGEELDTALESADDTPGAKERAEALARHLRTADAQRMRDLARRGEPIPLLGTDIVMDFTGGRYRVITDGPVDAGFIAEIAAAIGTWNIIALVIGSDAEEPRVLEFPPRGRPFPPASVEDPDPDNENPT